MWYVLTYGFRVPSINSFSPVTHSACSGFVARNSFNTLFVQNSADCHASATCACGKDIPMSAPWYATKESACTASANAFWWWNDSVRLPSLLAPTATIAFPTGVNNNCNVSGLGFWQDAIHAITEASRVNACANKPVTSTMSSPRGAASATSVATGPLSTSANAETEAWLAPPVAAGAAEADAAAGTDTPPACASRRAVTASRRETRASMIHGCTERLQGGQARCPDEWMQSAKIFTTANG